MKKFLKQYWFLILVYLAITIGMDLAFNKMRHEATEKAVNNAYVKGFEEGVHSVQLTDLCKDVEQKGFGTDFTQGYSYDVIQCKVNFRNWKEDWIIEGEPQETEDGLILEGGQSISI